MRPLQETPGVVEREGALQMIARATSAIATHTQPDSFAATENDPLRLLFAFYEAYQGQGERHPQT